MRILASHGQSAGTLVVGQYGRNPAIAPGVLPSRFIVLASELDVASTTPRRDGKRRTENQKLPEAYAFRPSFFNAAVMITQFIMHDGGIELKST